MIALVKTIELRRLYVELDRLRTQTKEMENVINDLNLDLESIVAYPANPRSNEVRDRVNKSRERIINLNFNPKIYEL